MFIKNTMYTLLFKDLFHFYLCVFTCVCASVSLCRCHVFTSVSLCSCHVCVGTCTGRNRVRCLGAGVTGGCKSPDVSTGMYSQVLCKSRNRFY